MGCGGDGGWCQVAVMGDAVVVMVGQWWVVNQFPPVQRKREREKLDGERREVREKI